MRLNRYLAQASGLSRRAADAALAAGRVQVDDETATPTTTLADEAKVALDGKILTLPTTWHYVIFHKPVGYICSRVQQGSAPTIYELLPPQYINLRSVGRLDRDSSGLLILTDDGDFAHRQTHPSFAKSKRYQVQLSQPLVPEDVAKLEAGVELEDGLSRLGLSEVMGRNLTVTLSEGRNRQIRRSFAALGYTVTKLHRDQFGALSLGSLVVGTWRELKPGEVTGA